MRVRAAVRWLHSVMSEIRLSGYIWFYFTSSIKKYAIYIAERKTSQRLFFPISFGPESVTHSLNAVSVACNFTGAAV